MVTKGIIKSIDLLGNTCTVHIPFFETAGNDPIVETATVSNTPGSYNGYKVGDVVYVAFEDGSMNNPVIIGKLYLGVEKEKSDPRGVVNVEESNSSKKATLPADAKLSIETSSNVPNTMAPYSSLSSIANGLNTLNTTVAQNDRDYGNRFKQVIGSINDLGTEYHSTLEQTAENIRAEVVSKYNDKESSFGWNLTPNDWTLYQKLSGESQLITKDSDIWVSTATFRDSSGTKTYYLVNGIQTDRIVSDTDQENLKIMYDDENHSWKWSDNTAEVKTKDGSGIDQVVTNIKKVLIANKDGLEVTGTIKAEAGHIGSFTIGNTGIYSDKYIKQYIIIPNTEGIYIGTDGIKLGKNFSVNTKGEVTATSLIIDPENTTIGKTDEKDIKLKDIITDEGGKIIQLQTIKNSTDYVLQRIEGTGEFSGAGLIQSVDGLNTSVTGLSNNVTGLSNNVTGLSNNVTGLSNNVNSIQNTVNTLNTNAITTSNLANKVTTNTTILNKIKSEAVSAINADFEKEESSDIWGNFTKITDKYITTTEVEATSLKVNVVNVNGLLSGDKIISDLIATDELHVNATNIYGSLQVGELLNVTLPKTNANGGITAGSVTIGGFDIGSDYISKGTLGQENSLWLSSSGNSAATTIANSESKEDWMITAGSKFGVTSDGTLYTNECSIQKGIFNGTLSATFAKLESAEIDNAQLSNINEISFIGDGGSSCALTAGNLGTAMTPSDLTNVKIKVWGSGNYTGTDRSIFSVYAGAFITDENGDDQPVILANDFKVNNGNNIYYVTFTASNNQAKCYLEFSTPITLKAGHIQSGTAIMASAKGHTGTWTATNISWIRPGETIATGNETEFEVALSILKPTEQSGLLINSIFAPTTGNKFDLGTANNPWNTIHVKTDQSDIRLKNSISYEKIKEYDPLFDDLRPATYRYNSDTDRNIEEEYWGFIAQDIKHSLDKHGLDDSSTYFLHAYDKKDTSYLALHYQSLHALEVRQIQLLKQRVSELEEKVEKLTKLLEK